MASIPLLRLSLLPLHHANPISLSSKNPNEKSYSLLYQNKCGVGPARLSERRRIAIATTTTCMSSFNDDNNRRTLPATDRLVSAAAYVLPLLKGINYGRFLFAKYPNLAAAFDPILPLLNLYHNIPYASLVAFFALYLGVARNPKLSRYVRFNAMQVILLNFLLVLPSLFQLILSPGRSGLGYKLMVMGHNALFVFVVCCFVYCVVCCILGRTPYLPFVAEAAATQM